MSTKPQSLKKVIDDLRQIIVGQVAMPHDQIDQITLFIFLKQLSRMNDELVRLGSKEIIFTGQYERYHFDVLIHLNGEEQVKECREAVESLYKNEAIDPTIRKVFERSYLKIMDSKVLSRFLAYLSDNITDEMDMGDFYESLLPILGTQNELGQFRTPRHIIDFMVQIIDPQIGETICDPACGTAGFLISAYKYMLKKYSDEQGNLTLNPALLKKLYNDTIYGWDTEPLMVKFSLANLYLHGLKNPNVSQADTLLNENLWQYSYDVIIANPPFITPKGGARRHARFTNKSNKTEVLFLEWMVHHLNYNGRMAVIVPEGIIFDSRKGHCEVRKLMIENGLWCVVSMPANLFQPYSGVKTSIVFLNKSIQTDRVMFCKIKNHGFSLNTNPVEIEANDLPVAYINAITFKQSVNNDTEYVVADKDVIMVEKSRLAESGEYNLNVEKYRQIEKMSAHFHVNKLSEVAEVIAGQSPEGKYYNESMQGLPFYQGKTEYQEIYLGKPTKWTTHITKRAYPNDIVMSVRAPVGPVNIVTKEICIGRGLAAIRCSEHLNFKFCFYMLRSMEDSIKGTSGSTFSAINKSEIEKIEIPVPPLSVQDEIVAELDSYQKIIDGAKQVVDNYKPHIEIDPSWRVMFLKDLCNEILSGGTPSTTISEYWIGNIPWITSADIVDYTTAIPRRFITDIALKNSATNLVPSGNIVVVTRVGLGKLFLNGFDVCISQDSQGLIINNDLVVSEYLLYALIDKVEVFIHTSQGTTIQGVTKDTLKNIKIPLPDIPTQQVIADRIDNEQKLVDANRQLISLYERKIKDRIDKLWRI